MLLLLDNFDSFTYNTVQYFQILETEVVVRRNNSITISECLALNPDHLIIGPGPGNPQNAGISKELIKIFSGKIPILGICLGHQCIAELFGGRIVRAKHPMHGKTSRIQHDGLGIFEGIPQNFEATRYHSLLVERETLPGCLEITAETAAGEIMGLRHRDLPIEGVQFHPESVLTEHGLQLYKKFIFDHTLSVVN